MRLPLPTDAELGEVSRLMDTDRRWTDSETRFVDGMRAANLARWEAVEASKRRSIRELRNTSAACAACAVACFAFVGQLAGVFFAIASVSFLVMYRDEKRSPW